MLSLVCAFLFGMLVRQVLYNRKERIRSSANLARILKVSTQEASQTVTELTQHKVETLGLDPSHWAEFERDIRDSLSRGTSPGEIRSGHENVGNMIRDACARGGASALFRGRARPQIPLPLEIKES